MDLAGNAGQAILAVRQKQMFSWCQCRRLQVDVAAGNDLSVDGKTLQPQYDGQRNNGWL